MGAESELEISQLLSKLVEAFTKAAATLEKEMANPNRRDPFVYVIPKMDLEVNLALSFSESTLKGFFKKSGSEKSSEVLSKLSMSVVSIPRNVPQ